MTNELYWISTITYAIVLIIILINDFWMKRKPNAIEKSFRLMVIWVIVFCIQDTIWGLCGNQVIGGDGLFFVSTSIFHVATVVTTFFWLDYVLIYLGDYIKHRKCYLLIDGVVILFELVLVFTNIFEKWLFDIEDGRYVIGPLRPLTFCNQYVVFLIIGILTFLYAVKQKGKEKNRFWTVFAFALAPIFMGIFQLLFPYAPFYSLGYFLGCFIVHIFVVSKDREEATKSNMLTPIANTFYSMHLIDIEENTVDPYIQSDIITNLVGHEKKAQAMLNKVFRGTVCEEYLDNVLEFADLSTISERMGDKNMISCEFIGKNFGWTRASFISVKKSNGTQKKVMLTTKIIDTEKKEQIELLFKSYNDELTGLHNRRAFENDLMNNKEREMENNLVFVSMDVNELKIVNDSLGHAAGDELLKGAADCMKKCLGGYGRLYRTGGDEFNAIIFANDSQLEAIKQDFEDTVADWHGELVDSMSVACGYVSRGEFEHATIQKMSALADERMYEDKAEFYRKKGIDRRGQRDAHAALCALYTKILKINITQDNYQVVNMAVEDEKKEEEYSCRISEGMSEFGKSGQVHPDDLAEYLLKTDLSYMRDYFLKDKGPLVIVYRRKFGDIFKRVMMEIIPANDYSEENQSLYLYVKKIEQ